MQTAYSRVTVVTHERTVDLALPSALPLSDVLPQLMRFVSPDHSDNGANPTSWTLAKVGGTTLPLSQTLVDAGVLDGDVLELRAQQQESRPAIIEDVRDAVEDSVDDAGGVWVTRTTGSFTVLVGGLVLGLVAVATLLADLWGDGWVADLGAPIAAAGTAALLLVAAWWATAFARDLDAQVAAGAAMTWGAVLGDGIGQGAGGGVWLRLLLAVVCVAVIAGIARLLSPALTGHAAFAAILLTVGAVHAIVGLLGWWTDDTRRVLPVLGLLAVGVMPRVSLSVGGLASADYRVRHVGRLDRTTLRSRYRASNALLVGSLVGIAAVVIWAGSGLALSDSPWDRALAAGIALAAVLRSRIFSRTQHMLPLRIAGLLVALVSLVRLAHDESALLPWLALVLAAVMAAGLGLASLQMSEITRARVKRTLNIVEFLAIVEMLVLLCGAVGIYARMGGLF